MEETEELEGAEAESLIEAPEPWEPWETRLCAWSVALGVGALALLGALVNLLLL